MTAQEAAKLAQQAAALEESRKQAREAKNKPQPKAATTKPKASTKANEPDLSGFDFFTRPQYAVLRSALRRSEAKLVGQQRLDDGTLVYVGLDKDGKVVRQGRIDPGVDYPSKGQS